MLHIISQTAAEALALSAFATTPPRIAQRNLRSKHVSLSGTGCCSTVIRGLLLHSRGMMEFSELGTIKNKR